MIGSNVSTVGGFRTGFRNGDEWHCECIQIYITLSRRWEVVPLSEDVINQFIRDWKESKVKLVVAHIPFLVNLASPNQELYKKSIDRLITEVNRANILGIPYLVLHPGAFTTSTREEGIKRLIVGLNSVSKKINEGNAKILLETMAGQGTLLGGSFKELALILEGLESPEFFGVCFDTAHVFIAGYDLRGYQGYSKVTEKFDEIIGLDKIFAFHINDAKTNLGSRNDRHECIGEGMLGLQVFHALVRDKRFENTPKILEIPDRDGRSKDNLDLLRKLRGISGPIMENSQKQLTLDRL